MTVRKILIFISLLLTSSFIYSQNIESYFPLDSETIYTYEQGNSNLSYTYMAYIIPQEDGSKAAIQVNVGRNAFGLVYTSRLIFIKNNGVIYSSIGMGKADLDPMEYSYYEVNPYYVLRPYNESWQEGNKQYKVTKGSISFNSKTYNDCLIVTTDYENDGIVLVSYYAKDIGLVYEETKYSDGTSNLKKLISITQK